MFIDSHCHIDFPVFDRDRDQVLQLCEQLGVRKILVPGVCPNQWQTLVNLCRGYPELVFSVGLHPWRISALESPFAALENLHHYLNNSRCVAIGECGLDYAIETPGDLQLQVFERQLSYAHARNIPAVIHCVRAHNDVIRLINQFTGIRGVIHAFSGSYEMAMDYWNRGFFLGVGGTITYPRARKTREAVARMPLEALLLETDSPDMPLFGKQGQRNSPECVPKIAEALASLKAISVEQVAQQTTKNFDCMIKRN